MTQWVKVGDMTLIAWVGSTIREFSTVTQVLPNRASKTDVIDNQVWSDFLKKKLKLLFHQVTFRLSRLFVFFEWTVQSATDI